MKKTTRNAWLDRWEAEMKNTGLKQPRRVMVFREYFYNGKNYREIGEELNITATRAQQICMREHEERCIYMRRLAKRRYYEQPRPQVDIRHKKHK